MSKNLPSSGTNWHPIMTYIHPPVTAKLISPDILAKIWHHIEVVYFISQSKTVSRISNSEWWFRQVYRFNMNFKITERKFWNIAIKTRDKGVYQWYVHFFFDLYTQYYTIIVIRFVQYDVLWSTEKQYRPLALVNITFQCSITHHIAQNEVL